MLYPTVPERTFFTRPCESVSENRTWFFLTERPGMVHEEENLL